MALVKNQNSYVTVQEADAYFADLLQGKEWADVDPADKEKALISATATLDNMIWVGSVQAQDQPLAFPRKGSFFDPRMGTVVTLGTTVPSRVITACCEQALHLVSNPDTLSSAGAGVRDLKVDTIELSFIRQTSTLSDTVSRLVQPLLKDRGVNAWWRAN